MGVGTQSDSLLALVFLCDLINRVLPSMNARVDCFRPVNRVAAVKLGVDLDIERLASDFKIFGSYEPSSFPGMKLQISDLDLTFVIFHKSGTVNIAGIKSPQLLPYIARRLRMLEDYAVKDADSDKVEGV